MESYGTPLTLKFSYWELASKKTKPRRLKVRTYQYVHYDVKEPDQGMLAKWLAALI